MYQDSLLSLNSAGFLSQNEPNTEIFYGLKGYFAKLKEKEAEKQVETDDSSKDEAEEQEPGKIKIPELMFTAEEYEAWCRSDY